MPGGSFLLAVSDFVFRGVYIPVFSLLLLPQSL
jgi:hypothetical protein